MAKKEDHFQRLRRLLDLEARAEDRELLDRLNELSAEKAEREGLSLVDLVLTGEESGFGAYDLYRFEKRGNSPLPAGDLRTGAPVRVRDAEESRAGQRGLITDLRPDSVQVALSRDLPEAERYRVDQANEEIPIKRQRKALEVAAEASSESRLGKVREVLLGREEPGFVEPWPPVERWLDERLNESQREAVRLALAAKDVAVIHGPPGTGKTTAVVELIRQELARGSRVLACGPSHRSVDNILERLTAAEVPAVRLGHPARVAQGLKSYTLYAQAESHPELRQVSRLRTEVDKKYRKARQGSTPYRQRRELRREARQIRREIRELEDRAVRETLSRAPVVCSTLTGLSWRRLKDEEFDVVVIDEACQSVEPACWIPLQFAGRLVLAGDHCQLPPTVISQRAMREGFGRSMQERLVDLFGDRITRQLTVQYRMHEAIMRFSSEQFYRGTLEAHDSVAQHRLADLPRVEADEPTEAPLLFIDSAGAGWDETLEASSSSRLNPREAELVIRKLETLQAAGVDPEQVAVITPYSAQVRELKRLLGDVGVEIDTVDGFQGREKEAVIISLVRSNMQAEVGFLSDTRRMNVALTRGRRQVLVIGDSATIGAHPFYSDLLDYFEAEEAWRTVWEEEI